MRRHAKPSQLFPGPRAAPNCCCRCCRCRAEEVQRTPNGDVFVKSSLAKGILPEILEELLSARKRCATGGWACFCFALLGAHGRPPFLMARLFRLLQFHLLQQEKGEKREGGQLVALGLTTLPFPSQHGP
jgi:hypothetical protein